VYEPSAASIAKAIFFSKPREIISEIALETDETLIVDAAIVDGCRALDRLDKENRYDSASLTQRSRFSRDFAMSAKIPRAFLRFRSRRNKYQTIKFYRASRPIIIFKNFNLDIKLYIFNKKISFKSRQFIHSSSQLKKK